MVCSAMVSCFFFWFFFCKDLDNNSFFSKNLYFLHTELTHAYSNSYPPPHLTGQERAVATSFGSVIQIPDDPGEKEIPLSAHSYSGRERSSSN